MRISRSRRKDLDRIVRAAMFVIAIAAIIASFIQGPRDHTQLRVTRTARRPASRTEHVRAQKERTDESRQGASGGAHRGHGADSAGDSVL